MSKTYALGRAGLALSLLFTPLTGCFDEAEPDLAADESEVIFPGPSTRCFGKAENDSFGHVTAAGDFDGDGDVDLAVAAPSDNDYRLPVSGAIYVYRRSGTSLTPWARISPSQLGIGATQSTKIGQAMVAADFDGDGMDELAIHTNGPNANAIFPGRVLVAGVDASDDFVLQQIVSQAGLGTDASGDRFGEDLEVGDFDADGVTDLVVGAWRDNEGTTDWIGRVYVFRGGGAQLAPWKVLTPQTLNLRNARFGETLAVGDFDANGYDDLAVGMPYHDLTANPYAQGTVVTFRSAAGAPLTTARLLDGRLYVNPSGTTRAHFGAALAALDMDGDGDDELAVGAPEARYGSSDMQAGAVTIFRNVVGTPSLWHTIQLPFPGANQGKWLAAGDFNGNGADDLAVGEDPYEAIGSLIVWKGRVGNTPVLGDTYDERLDAIDAADIDGDGKTDLLVSLDGSNKPLTYGLGRSMYMPLLDRTLYQQEPGCTPYWGAAPVITLRGARQRELDLRITSSGTVDQVFWMRQNGSSSWYEYAAVGDRTDTGLTAGTQYCYTGKTLQVGSDAYSDWTTTCFNTAAPITAPTITLTGTTTSSISVRMVASSGGDRIRSQLQNNASSSQTTIGSTVNRTFTGLSAGTQYCIVADAFHPAVNDWSQPRTSCFSTQQATQTGTDSVTLNAMSPPPPQGPIPYTGTWWADAGQRPVRIRVPASIGDYWIHFVKAGHSTAECFGPNHANATVTVQDGGTLDAAAIALIQGGTPPPGQDLGWVACHEDTIGGDSYPSWVAFYLDWENP